MSTTDDLRGALRAIRERAGKATEGPWEISGSLIEGPRYAVGQAFGIKWRDDLAFIAHARADVPRLVAALEAVLEAIEQYPAPSKRDDPTGEIACAIEEFGDAVQDALTAKLTGEDDEQ